VRHVGKAAVVAVVGSILAGVLGLVIIAHIIFSLGGGGSIAACHAHGEEEIADATSVALQEIPHWLLPIYAGAAQKYHLGSAGWAVLASINFQETTFGSNLATSSAGAVGWMQFEPSTWAQYGVDPEGHRVPVSDAYNPQDAIYTAANYLHASGAPASWYQAVFAYNHSAEYVNAVLTRAKNWLADPTALNFSPQGGGENPPGEVLSVADEEGGTQEVQIVGHAVMFAARSNTRQILVRDPATVGRRWTVTAGNRVIIAAQPGVGPAPTHGDEPRIALSPAAVAALGLTASSVGTVVVSARIEGESGGGCEGGDPSNATAEAVEEQAARLAAMHLPYVWGGGHDSTPAEPSGGPPPGLDCSGSVSWVLQHAGFHIPTMVSGDFEHWGDPGPGKWITIFANPEHVFMRIASPRHPKPRYFGTGAWGSPYSGPEWFADEPTQSWLDGFVEVHPPGL
jgi:cell wall-associated NlpC family hydrolase